MRWRSLTTAIVAVGAIGLALLLFESVQAMRGVIIGTIGTTLLFLGLGLVVTAALLIGVAVAADLRRQR
jgi:hypothetical protein